VHWLLTRELSDAKREQALLRTRGVDASVVPCIAFVERPWPRWRGEPGRSVTLLTSRRAAGRYVAQQESRTSMVAALAPSTTALLSEHGVQVDVAARGGVIVLAEAIAQAWRALGRPRWHFRYPTSDAGLEREEQAQAVAVLSELGPVERQVVYETRAADGLPESLSEVLLAQWAACFSSPSAVDAFLGAVPSGAAPPAHAVCFGRSTAQRWNARRPPAWREAVLTPSVVDTVVSLEEQP
jgi:uroporphyrinogen-III synthase